MTMNPHAHVTTVVRQVVAETARISRFELSCPDFWELPPFTAGAHIDVRLPDGGERQYSLCSHPAERTRYQIAVLREDAGRGGSLAMHRQLRPGDGLPVSIPRNLFALSAVASRHVFIAGGVGITPFMAMIATLERQRVPYELLRRPQCRRHCVCLHAAAAGSARPGALLRRHGAAARPGHAAGSPKAGEPVYCCGPARLLDGFLDATRHWPDGTVHHERFGKDPAQIDSPPYSVRLVRSRRTVQVAANQTLAAALMASGAPVQVACEAGVCGKCVVRHVGGSPRHHDLILSPGERVEMLTPCVSGQCEGLELDL